MRIPIIAALVCLPLAAHPWQDDEEPGSRDPFTALAERESLRIEEEIEGAWIMMGYQHPGAVIDPTDTRGFFVFHDGYMTLTLQARKQTMGIFRERTEYTVQAGAYRYRIDRGRRLQTAGLMGFSNATPGGDLDFENVVQPEEYDILLAGQDLTLTRPDGRVFQFRRMERTEFPQDAVERLDRLRGAMSNDPGGQGQGR
jgi:hypothetical protein